MRRCFLKDDPLRRGSVESNKTNAEISVAGGMIKEGRSDLSEPVRGVFLGIFHSPGVNAAWSRGLL